MLIEDFDNWRKERQGVSANSRVHIPCFTNSASWKEDFFLFIRARYAEQVSVELVTELAWQVYMLQACVEGFIEDFEEIQDELLSHGDEISGLGQEIEDMYGQFTDL